MLEQLQNAYITYKWVRLAACAGLLIASVLLYWLPGGFPPWAWRFLAQVIPTAPALWAQRGGGMLLPLIGLALLSTTVLLCWCAIALASLSIVCHWWQERRELQQFNGEAEEAQNQILAMQQEPLGANSPAELNLVAASPAPLAAKGTSSPAAFRHSRYQTHELPLAQTPVPVDDPPTITFDIQTSSKPRVPTRPPASTRQQSQGTLQLAVGTGLHTGIKRKGKPNEDDLLVLQSTHTSNTGCVPVGLFVVADGMGGHSSGQEASHLAIQTMSNVVMPKVLSSGEDKRFVEFLSKGVQDANLAVFERNQEQHADMGTTMTAALVVGTTAYVANVGDSRTYLYRASSGLTQITRDHSTVAQLVEHGLVTPDEVYTHPKRNEIYRCLGDKAPVEVDTFTESLQKGDLLLLCSDGLWEMVYDEDISEILKAALPYPHPSQLSAMLVQAALNRGGKDNISVVVVYIRE
jgi:serine/threonine protein phosphatase PrpC